MSQRQQRAHSRAAAAARRAENFKEHMRLRLDDAFDFEDKRVMVATAFANLNAKYKGHKRLEAVRHAAEAHAVSRNFVWRHGLDAERTEGFFSDSTWGKHTKTPWKLSDLDIFNKCKQYCRDNNGHRRDKPNMTAARFAQWLQEELDISVSHRQAAVYLGRLGVSWEAVKKGSYVDNHEAEWALQHEREFLKAYLEAYNQGTPHPSPFTSRPLTLAPRPLSSTSCLALAPRPRAATSPLNLAHRPHTSTLDPRPRASTSILALAPRPLSSTSCLTLAPRPRAATSPLDLAHRPRTSPSPSYLYPRPRALPSRRDFAPRPRASPSHLAPRPSPSCLDLYPRP